MQNWNINPHSLLNIKGNVWLYWKDMHGRYMGCNDLMATSLNLSSNRDIIDKTDFDLNVAPNEIDFYRSCDERVLEKGIPLQFNDSATLLNKKIEFNVIKSPLYENKKPVGIIGLSYYVVKSDGDIITVDDVALSLRESQIVRELIRGKYAKEIAQCLGLSTRTVEAHLANIKRKLNVSSKCKLIDKVFDYC